MAVYFMGYNFVRIHQTLKITPAMAAGVASKLWGVKVLEEWEMEKQGYLSRFDEHKLSLKPPTILTYFRMLKIVNGFNYLLLFNYNDWRAMCIG